VRPWRRRAGLPKTMVVYHWRCPCGAHSRGGDWNESHAHYLAQSHQWSKPVPHPEPEVYATEEEDLWPDP
jgi:hypothetical protein